MAWDGNRLAGALLGGTRVIDQSRVAWVRLVTVDPAYRRQGLASRLLEELESRLRADGLTRLAVANSMPAYFWPGVDLRYTPAVCFFLARGFTRHGDAVNMLVDLDARDWDTGPDEERLAREGIVVRRLRPDDRAAFDEWLAANWSATWYYEGLAAYDNDP